MNVFCARAVNGGSCGGQIAFVLIVARLFTTVVLAGAGFAVCIDLR